ncbi:hypothetical protein BGX27_002814, partial [Mortierella sp. AM989]
MRASLLASVKEIVDQAKLYNPQYFLDTNPSEYDIEKYLVSCRGPIAEDESLEKRLQDDWWNKLIPKLKGSVDQCLWETATTLEKAKKKDIRRLQESE